MKTTLVMLTSLLILPARGSMSLVTVAENRMQPTAPGARRG